MAGCSAKNRECAGGSKWCIGGSLVFEPGSKLIINEGAEIPEGFGGGGGAGAVSWDDLTDRPFGDKKDFYVAAELTVVYGEVYGELAGVNPSDVRILFATTADGSLIEYDTKVNRPYDAVADGYLAIWYGNAALLPVLSDYVGDNISECHGNDLPFLIYRGVLEGGEAVIRVIFDDSFPYSLPWNGTIQIKDLSQEVTEVILLDAKYLPKGYAVTDATDDTVMDTLNELLNSLRQAGYLTE